MLNFGDLWLAPILAVLAYLAADFLSGFVHFLADNFGSYDTPIIGPNFIEPFREHHIDPKGIVGNDFVDANGNNSLASLPFMLAVWIIVPLETVYFGYIFGVFSLFCRPRRRSCRRVQARPGARPPRRRASARPGP